MFTFSHTLLTVLELFEGSLFIEEMIFVVVVEALPLADVFTSEFVASESPFCNNGLKIFASLTLIIFLRQVMYTVQYL